MAWLFILLLTPPSHVLSSIPVSPPVMGLMPGRRLLQLFFHVELMGTAVAVGGQLALL